MKILKMLSVIALCTSSFCSIESTEDQRVFSVRNGSKVPDGTLVAPFFNPKDCTSNLPWDLIDELSIAAGEINKETTIHTMPLVTQIVYVLSGSLEVIVKEAQDEVPKVLHAEANEAVLTKPGSLFQLRNRGEGSCRVLYIVSPAYLFEMDETGSVVYDDAFIVKENWKQLELQKWKPSHMPSLESLRKARDESYFRLQTVKLVATD